MLRSNTVEFNGVPSNVNLQSVTNNNNPVDALPKQFIASMKKLFDILDDKKTGFVRYLDIEKNWQDDGCKGLPCGVLDSLRKVTPANGLLSFERFCAGLKLCLLRNQQTHETNITNISTSVNPTTVSKIKTRRSKSPRPPSLPLQEIETKLHNTTTWNNKTNATATIHPRNQALITQRTLSLPQLSPDSLELDSEMNPVNITSYNSLHAPPKPPRAAAVAAAKNATLDKSGIRNALQNWQMGLLFNEMDACDKRENILPNYFNNRGSADGGSSSATDSAISTATFLTPAKKNMGNLSNNNNSLGKRRETRRHTLQNGIDYNMLRRLKQYEEEREVLLIGLDAIEKTRTWYLRQIEHVQEKIRCLGRMGEDVDHWSEVQQERLNFQRARVLEVNRSLAALADSWERDCIVPPHFNLAISHISKNSNHLNNVGLYMGQEHRRHQNCYSTNDDQTTQRLERENRTLLCELLELRQNSMPRRVPLCVSQSQTSPVCSSSPGGGLIDADIVY